MLAFFILMVGSFFVWVISHSSTEAPKPKVVEKTEVSTDQVTLYSDSGDPFIFASLESAYTFMELNDVDLAARCLCTYQGKERFFSSNEVDSLMGSREWIYCKDSFHLEFISDVSKGKRFYVRVKDSSSFSDIYIDNLEALDSALQEVSKTIPQYVSIYEDHYGVKVRSNGEIYPAHNASDARFFEKIKGQFYPLDTIQ